MCPPGPPPCSRPLSNISSNKESFDSATLLYQEALKKSGHDYQLNFNPTPSKRKQRSRNVIRYNPPYNANVDTNVGHKFLRTIDECFPKSHAFHIIFYRNTLKLGYSCMPNIGSVISLHNKALLSRANQNSPSATKNKQLPQKRRLSASREMPHEVTGLPGYCKERGQYATRDIHRSHRELFQSTTF